MTIGSTFKLFGRFRDGTRRPRLSYKSATNYVKLTRAWVRFRNHAIGGVELEITRTPIDFSRELTVVEHLKGGVTMVRDDKFRLAPIYSGLVLQDRTKQVARAQQHRARS